MIIVANAAFGQNIIKNNNNKKPVFTTKIKTEGFNYIAKENKKPVSMISANYYVSQLGFFCTQELKFEKVTRLPLKLRLGSVQYCDWMEGKRSAGILPTYQ